MTTIPSEYGWAIAAVGAAAFTTLYGGFKVGMARKKYGVKCPKMYLEGDSKEAKAFNCVQRGHQNALEWLAPVQVMTLANAAAYPIASSALCGVWTIGKLLYIRGYASGDPDRRRLGAGIAHLGDLPLIVMCFFSANKLLSGA